MAKAVAALAGMIFVGFFVVLLIMLFLMPFGGNANTKRAISATNSEPFEGCRSVEVEQQYNESKPYTLDTNEGGQFEQDFVYRNEGAQTPTQDAINAARRRFPFDWAQLPPSSSLFQQQQALFVSNPLNQAATFTTETFENLESEKVLPPDAKLKEEVEKELLQEYQAKDAGDLKTVDDQNVEELIKKLYGKRGFIAKVAKRPNNVYEVYELIEKEPKITYEDEVQASIQSNDLNPLVEPTAMILRPDTVRTAEETLQRDPMRPPVAPPTQIDTNIGLAPRGNGEMARPGRQALPDYNPNLQDLFGPLMNMQSWFGSSTA